ncbi:MAG TPA: DUF488 family protein [Streptosporangiaceae bacterium]|nr:DUF488 family protein [Streptosporangiaceae bacterium]
MSSKPDVRIRRIYEAPSSQDGKRILVDRLWPRGVSKDAGAFDEWLKEVAPSSELRQWYRHEPARFDEFKRRYMAELNGDGKQHEAWQRLVSEAGQGPVTLLTATRDIERSEAAVLADELMRQ